MKDSVVIDPKDNVCVCLAPCGEIPAGHKRALRFIAKGEYVIKYGYPIGRATQDIKEGEWVHTHNLSSHLDGAEHYRYSPVKALSAGGKEFYFNGYRNAYGRAGIRNDIYIIPTVGCVNGVCRTLEQEAQQFVGGSIDKIIALTHPFGCSQLGQDGENIRKLLAAIALHPNAAYVLFVGLGCENNSLRGMQEYLRPFARENIAFYNCQDVEDEIGYGLSVLREFADAARRRRRERVSSRELCIGLKCGGSDGFSGITANPLVGKISDRVVAAGGAAVLGEIPEMFGAEQIMLNKSKNEAVFGEFERMISDFKKGYIEQGFPVYENPSPGNRQGGITTLEEKSLGCIEKAGRGQVSDVLDYGERMRDAGGITVLNTPGNDLIAATAIAAAGCQIVLFTTGRGTPFSTFVPTMKIASNDRLADYKEKWIDFGAYGMDEEGLFSLLLQTLNGEYHCKTEHLSEIAFYKTGVTL